MVESQNELPDDGVYLFVKQDCPTCRLVEPVVRQLQSRSPALTIFVQDDMTFFAGVEGVRDDRSLEQSYHSNIEFVPTLIEISGGQEVRRVIGWDRQDWQSLFQDPDLGADLPVGQPACGSLSVAPGAEDYLRGRFGPNPLKSRSFALSRFDDPVEQAYDRGWTDGLPVVPPTAERISRMLAGTNRDPQEVIGNIPPNLAECTVEKVAINAVLAGCLPQYMPVVLATLETALEPNFTLHGLLCTTCFSSPIIIVNGPIAGEIGMNWGINALGQGNRANATIGRAVQLIVRNVGGGKPGEIDRATLGNPGKYTFCFAEDETDPTWKPLSEARGFAPGSNTVTLFPGDGVHGFGDSRSRTPEELTRSYAMGLLGCLHPKLCEATYAVLIISPEHYAIYRQAGWDRDKITSELYKATVRPGRDLIRGAQGVGEGIDPARADEDVAKFYEEGLLIVRAGGPAGLFSGILTGWTAGRHRDESKPITREIKL